MEYLFSNFKPLETANKKFSEVFYSFIPAATRLDIAVGFITADSLAELKQAIAYNENIEQLNLIIGMHRWEKFTRVEYSTAMELNDYLRKNKRGEVRLVTPFRFHGKLYTYSKDNKAFAGIIGSNNLSSIIDGGVRTYEAAFLFREQLYAQQMRNFIDELSQKAADNLADCRIEEFKQKNELLEGHEYVEKISRDKLSDYISSLTEVSFEIPLTRNGAVPPKSNLNVYFGEGRRSKSTGLIIPRHWYETELIVPKEVTSLSGYPQAKTPTAVFDVITDDGWKFKCKVSGDFSKNLRSEGDLKILGKWIKGRLENNGALEVMKPVTPDTFVKYGRSSLRMTQTTTPNLWYLDFGVR